VRSARMNFWVSLAITLVVLSATAFPLCGLMFRCGCTFSRGAQLCSIHHADMPHCPWCVKNGKAFGISFLVVLSLVTASLFAVARRQRSIWIGSIFGVVVYLLAAVAAGWATAKMMDYPTWFGLAIR
jgi:hypothetical protein